MQLRLAFLGADQDGLGGQDSCSGGEEPVPVGMQEDQQEKHGMEKATQEQDKPERAAEEQEEMPASLGSPEAAAVAAVAAAANRVVLPAVPETLVEQLEGSMADLLVTRSLFAAQVCAGCPALLCSALLCI